MKTITPLLIIGLIVAAFLGGLLFHQIKPPASPQQLTLEQILSIRELHLVQHTYQDVFYLHRHNDPGKPIRAIIKMPVTVTAYLNLKDIKLVFQGDTVSRVILPPAVMHGPVYHMNAMNIRETRGFQVHLGRDLYPKVGGYLGALIQERMDTTRHLAETDNILLRAEAEGKEYVQSILTQLGHKDVLVTFNDEHKDQEVNEFINTFYQKEFVPTTRPNPAAKLSVIPFGLLPLP
jgi:Protein of unknown function (DUF4230)